MKTKRRKIYLSGPMTGIPEHNYPAFRATAERLRILGWNVVDPSRNFGGRRDLPREIYMRHDFRLLTGCDALAQMCGWEKSRGALGEYYVAQEMGLNVYDAAGALQLNTPLAKIVLNENHWAEDSGDPESILDEAKRITGGERNADYGHPRDDFARAAHIWTGILRDRLAPGASIKAEDIALCMIGVKLAREAHKHKRDNLVDIAGYARTLAMVRGDE